jgi:hypothetical protein
MTTPSTRTLMRLHRYAGLMAAPLLFFFAISGTWQIFRLHESRRDGSYTAPKMLSIASDFHKAERMGSSAADLAFKSIVASVAILFALSALLGVWVALRTTRPRWLALALLALGIAVPLLLYLAARTGAPPPGP